MSVHRSKVGERSVMSFEPGQNAFLTHNASGDKTVTPDTVNFKEGTQGLRFRMPTGGQIIAKLHRYFDLNDVASDDVFSIDVYITKKINNWLRISFTSDLAGAGDILRKNVSVSDMEVGWNTITWTRSEMAAFGGWSTDPRGKGVQVDLYHNVSESIDVTLDNFKVSVATDVRS